VNLIIGYIGLNSLAIFTLQMQILSSGIKSDFANSDQLESQPQKQQGVNQQQMAVILPFTM
jgi:hypothetical protein